MSPTSCHVLVAPWGTIEADCLAHMLREAGMVAVERATDETAACVLAPPRCMPLSEYYPFSVDRADLPTLLVTSRFDARAIALAQVTGAVGVLTWENDAYSLIEAVVTLAAGEDLPRSRRQTSRGPSDPCARMTERERDVLGLVAIGHRDDEIAGRLGISSHTVRTHLQHAMTKLEVTHRRAAAAIVHASPIMRAHSTSLALVEGTA